MPINVSFSFSLVNQHTKENQNSINLNKGVTLTIDVPTKNAFNFRISIRYLEKVDN